MPVGLMAAGVHPAFLPADSNGTRVIVGWMMILWILREFDVFGADEPKDPAEGLKMRRQQQDKLRLQRTTDIKFRNDWLYETEVLSTIPRRGRDHCCVG